MGCRNSSHVIGKKRIVSGDDNGHFSAPPHETSYTKFDTKRADGHMNNNGSVASSKSSSRMQTDSSGILGLI